MSSRRRDGPYFTRRTSHSTVQVAMGTMRSLWVQMTQGYIVMIMMAICSGFIVILRILSIELLSATLMAMGLPM